MTNRLVILLPTESINIVSDNFDKINKLSDFCKKELGAYRASSSIDELTIDSISEDMSDKLYSIMFELGLL